MNIAEFFIRRPVMTTLVMLAILIFGIVAYRALPVSDLPNVDFPTILVMASLPGANPDTMASAVATPLERQFSTIAGLDSMTSTSGLGNTQITLQFNLSRNIDGAAQDVQAAIARAGSQLPADMPTPPSYQKVNPADQPILYLALTSATLPLYDVHEYGDTLMAQRISMVNGVAQVQIFGAQKYAVRVQVDPRALASRSIGIDEVVQAVQRANVNLPTGTFQGSQQAYTIQASGQLTRAAAYRPTIVAYRQGRPVRLEELGRAIDSVENDKIAAWYLTPEEQPRSIILAIQRQPGTNTLEVANAVKALLPQFEKLLPSSVKLYVLYDRSVSIQESVTDVKFTLILTLCLVVLVIFLFLRKVSATIIPSLALPFSIVGTFAVMYLFGYSIDNLSLLALTLSVGFVVDDAIVMLENIVRHLEMGKPVMEAALVGSREVGFTIVSMTLSLAAVFIPVLFMGGLMGRLLNEFAVTIATAILVSGVVSVTLTPMLCSRFLRPAAAERHGPVFNFFERLFDGMLRAYDWSLRLSLRLHAVVMLMLVLLIAGTAYYFVVIPKGFLPLEDTGQIFMFTEGAEGVSFDGMVEHQKALMEVVRTNPHIQAFTSSIGPTGAMVGTNAGRMFLRLKPRDQRPGAAEIIRELRPQVAQVPGIKAFPQILPPVRIGGQLTKSLYQLTLQSPSTEELYQFGPKLEERMRGLALLTDVTSDLQIRNPQLQVDIDRDKIATLGLSAAQVEEALSSAYSSRWISTIYAPNNQYRVIIELEPQYQRDTSALSMLYLRSNSGQLVPIDSVVRVRRDVGPLSVSHSGQLPSVTLSFNLAPGASLSQALAEVDKVAREIGLPSTISTTLQGTAQAYQESQKGLGLLLVMAVFVIYLILGILYESFIHPLTILSGLPAAGVGALATLALFRAELNVYSFVGLIMLIGIVKKNAIMMIDFALAAERKEGKKPADAIYEACLIRFRPIMMTTMAALMGILPIALGFGAGAESRRPLGLAVLGGLVISQFLTLYITPVIYIYLDNLSRLFRRKRRAPEEEPHQVPDLTGSTERSVLVAEQRSDGEEGKRARGEVLRS